MADPCPVCGKVGCQAYLGDGSAAKRFFHTERDLIAGGNVLRLTEAVYVNSDYTKVLKEGDPESAFLLGGKGTLITEADAKRLGVKTTESVDNLPAHGSILRAQLAHVPLAPQDESLYDDQSERGKEARRLAREANGVLTANAEKHMSNDEAVQHQRDENANLAGDKAKSR